MSTLNTEENPFDSVPETEVTTDKDPFATTYDVFSEEDIVPEEEEKQEEEEEVEKPKPKPKTKPTQETVDTKVEAGKAILQYLAQRKGIAADIDFDTIKTEDDIADLVEAIEELDEASAFERIKSSNKEIKKVVEYLQAGGDSTKISKLLTEQEEILSIDVTTESGAKSLLKQYYKNVLGFEDDAIEKRIKRFSD